MSSPTSVYSTISATSHSIENQDVSPVELVQSSLNRIKQLDGELNSFITVCEQPALKAAKKAEREIAVGKYRGPMHGIPIAVKDIYATKGIRTTCGYTIL